MSKYPLPGTLWVGFFLALVPAVSTVLTQYFPEAQYWWSPVIVTLLAATAKAAQVAMAKQLTVIDTSVNGDGAALPATASAPDGDDYTYGGTLTVAPPSKLAQWLLG